MADILFDTDNSISKPSEIGNKVGVYQARLSMQDATYVTGGLAVPRDFALNNMFKKRPTVVFDGPIISGATEYKLKYDFGNVTTPVDKILIYEINHAVTTTSIAELVSATTNSTASSAINNIGMIAIGLMG